MLCANYICVHRAEQSRAESRVVYTLSLYSLCYIIITLSFLFMFAVLLCTHCARIMYRKDNAVGL